MKKRILCSSIVAILVLSITINVFAADWVLIDSGNHQAFWGHNATVTDVCFTITDALYESGARNYSWSGFTVLLAVGLATIGYLADETTGCMVYTRTYTMTITGQPVHYMYEWWLIDTEGNKYGPYKVTPNPYSPNSLEDEEIKEQQ